MRPVSELQRRVEPFQVISDYVPAGDQPEAIEEIARRINAGEQDVVLLGATGTGKSATTAWLIEKLQRPTLVLAPNKTLAAQLANEFRELLPNNAVEYFVSYYDYYQPEAYVPQTDTFIEKDSSVNDEVERLRHSATNSLLTRRDVIVVATVSCIYGLGTPQEYVDRMIKLRVGDEIERNALLRKFVDVQYKRNDVAFERGTFRVRGDTIEIIPMYEELAIRIEMFGDEIEKITTLHPLTGEIMRDEVEMYIFPATHYAAGPETMKRAIGDIQDELQVQLNLLEKQGKLLEAQRLRMRTTFDIEMMEQIGFCSGIENYSRHLDDRAAGSAPNCLLDYFPEDFLVVIDESHVTIPQLRAMYAGDRSCLNTLQQALDLAEKIEPDSPSLPSLGVAVDVYHVWWDPDLAREIARAGKANRLFGYHVCDWLVPTRDLLTDRGMMGDGVIDLRMIRALMESANYNGPVEVEIFSSLDWWKRPMNDVLAICSERLQTVC